MSDEFNGTSSASAGAALQAAWLGGAAISRPLTATSHQHMTITSCTAMVRRVLYAADRAMKLGELHDKTGHSRAAIGSALVKMQQLGQVRKQPPPGGGCWGGAYEWVSDVVPGVRQRARG